MPSEDVTTVPLEDVLRAGVMVEGGRVVAAWHVTSCETLRPVPVLTVEAAVRTRAGRAAALLTRVVAVGTDIDRIVGNACEAVLGDAAMPTDPSVAYVRVACFADVVSRMRRRVTWGSMPWPKAEPTPGHRSDVEVPLMSFLDGLDPEALATLRPEGRNDLLHGCWEAFDATFVPGAPLRRAMASHPHLAWTLAEGWRSGRARYGCDATGEEVVAAALAEAKRSRQLPGWLIARFDDAQSAYAEVAAAALASLVVPPPGDDAFLDLACNLRELPTNWVPDGRAEWVAYFEVAGLIPHAANLSPRSSPSGILAVGGRWRRWRDSLTAAAGVPVTELAAALRDVEDVEASFESQVLAPAHALVGSRRSGGDSESLARSVLWSKSSLRRVLEVSRAWHSRRARIAAKLATLHGSVQAVTSWAAGLPPMSSDGTVLVVVETLRDLLAEGGAGLDADGHPGLDHCVASYLSRCLAGTVRIASVRAEDGTRLSTVAFDMTRDGAVLDHRGPRNAVPTARAQALVDRYVAAMAAGEFEVVRQPAVPGHDRALLNAGYDWREEGNWDRAVAAWGDLLPRRVREASPASLVAATGGGAARDDGVGPAFPLTGDAAADLRRAVAALLPHGPLWRGGRIVGFWFAGPPDRDARHAARLVYRRADGSCVTAVVDAPPSAMACAVRAEVRAWDHLGDGAHEHRDTMGSVVEMLRIAHGYRDRPEDACLERLGPHGRMMLGAQAHPAHEVERHDAFALGVLSAALPGVPEAALALAAAERRERVADCAARYRDTCDPESLPYLDVSYVTQWRGCWGDLDGGRRLASPLRDVTEAHPHLSHVLARRWARHDGRDGPPHAWDAAGVMRMGEGRLLWDLASGARVGDRLPEIVSAIGRHWPGSPPSPVDATVAETVKRLIGRVSQVAEDLLPVDEAGWAAFLDVLHASLAPRDTVWWRREDIDAGDGWRAVRDRLLEAARGDLVTAMLRFDQHRQAFVDEVVRPAAVVAGLDTLGSFGTNVGCALREAEGSLAASLEASHRWRKAAPAMRAALDALPGRPGATWDPVIPDHVDGMDGTRIRVLTTAADLVAGMRVGPLADGSEGLGLRYGLGWDAPRRCLRGEVRLVTLHDRCGRWLALVALTGLEGRVEVDVRGTCPRDDRTSLEAALALARYLRALDDGSLPVGAAAPLQASPAILHPGGYDVSVPGNVGVALDLWRPLLPEAVRDRSVGWWVERGLHSPDRVTA